MACKIFLIKFHLQVFIFINYEINSIKKTHLLFLSSIIINFNSNDFKLVILFANFILLFFNMDFINNDFLEVFNSFLKFYIIFINFLI